MSHSMTPQQIVSCAREATSLMDRHDALPAPENYELWYWYASQRNGAINVALDGAVREGRASDLEHARELHARFFGSSAGEAFQEIGQQLSEELRKLAGTMHNAGTDAADFGQTLAAAVDELGRGNFDIRSVVRRLTEATQAVQARNEALEAQLRASMDEVEGLRTRMDMVRKESLTDALTGLANRRCFDEAAEREADIARSEGRPMSLVICDVDHFKKFNDTWGHQIGDQVLRLVGQCLKTNVKGKDIAARFGGEEFVVILPGTTLDNAAHLADEFRRTVESKKIVQKSTGRDMGTVTLSLGVAQYQPGEPITELVNRADACLYAAKRAGRNRVMTERQLAAQVAGSAAQAAASASGLERSRFSLDFEDVVRAARPGDGHVPLRSSIDLRQFHRFARWMVLAEADVERRQVPMRLVGSAFHDVLGRDATGADYLEFADPAIRDRAFDTIMTLVKTPCALWQVVPVKLPGGKTALFEFTTFPVFNDREQRHQFLALVHQHSADGIPMAGDVRILKASAFTWIDLGRGTPGSAKTKTAA